MSLSDLASLGSFISGLAIVVTLLFLLLQMRQSDRNQQSLIQQGRTVHLDQVGLSRVEPHLSAAFACLIEDHQRISPSEIYAIRAYLSAYTFGFQDNFQQYRSGTLSRRSWEVDVSVFRVVTRSAAFRTEWMTMRDAMTPEWRDFVDGLIREAQVSTHHITRADWLTRYEQQLAA